MLIALLFKVIHTIVMCAHICERLLIVDGVVCREEPDEPEPEVGPALLTPLSEDAEMDNMPAWTAKMSSRLIPQYAICIVRSNLWPGATAFANDKYVYGRYIF